MSIFFIPFQDEIQGLPPNTFVLGKNSETVVRFYMEKGNSLNFSFNSSNEQPLFIAILNENEHYNYFQGKAPVYVFYTYTTSLFNQSIFFLESTYYYIMFYNFHYLGSYYIQNEQTTISYRIISNNSSSNAIPSFTSSVPTTINYFLDESVKYLFLLIILIGFPLFVFFVVNKEFRKNSEIENNQRMEIIQLWKSSLFVKMIGVVLLILPSYFVMLFILAALHEQYVGVIGMAVLVSISNLIVSRRFINWSSEGSNNKLMKYYYSLIPVFFILLSLVTSQFNLLIKSISGLRIIIEEFVLNINFIAYPEDIMYILVVFTFLFLLLGLFIFYQILFTEKRYFDSMNLKIILELKVIFLPLTLRQEFSLDELSRGFIRTASSTLGVIYSFFLIERKTNKSILIIQGTQQEVYKGIYNLLNLLEIPIEEKRKIFLIKSKTIIISKDLILKKYPHISIL